MLISKQMQADESSEIRQAPFTDAVQRLSVVVTVCLALAALSALLGLLGTALDMRALAAIRADWPAMTPRTAVGLLSIVFSLKMIGGTRLRQNLACAALLIPALIGLESIVQYAVAPEGHLFFDHFIPTHWTSKPAPETAVCLLVSSVSVALLALARKPQVYLSQLLAASGTAIPILALTGYFSGVETLYSLFVTEHQVGMAFLTALGILSVSVATLLARPDRGFMTLIVSPTLGGTVARRVVTVTFLTPPLIGLAGFLGVERGFIGQGLRLALAPFLGSLLLLLVTWMTARRLDLLDRQRIASERELAESELRFRSIFDNSMDAIFLTSPDGDIITANMCAQSMLGYSEAELRALGRRVVVDSGDPRLAKALEERRQTGKYRGELTFVHRDGTRFPVELSSAVFKDEQGTEWTSMFVRDISQRKAAEKERERMLSELDHEKRWLDAVFEGAPIGMVMVRSEDPEHPVPNAHARKVFGSRIDWSLGRTSYLGSACDAKGRPFGKEELTSSRILRGETIIGEEQLLRFKDGGDFPIIAAGGPIQDESGKQIGAVSFFQDISALKELERLREEWSAVIAHDLRQPITTIYLQAGLLKSLPEVGERGRQVAAMIESSATHLNRMTHDLLDVSQLEARKMKLELQEADISRLLKEIVEKLVPIFPENPIRLELGDPLPMLRLDPGRIEQAIGNLISNASKYGDPKTEIRLAVRQAGGQVEISVSNKGKGIEKEDLGNLFQRFNRTGSAKKGRIKGVGLGLYLTKGLVEAHGGRIHVESTPGKTTTFTIELPVAEAARRGAGQVA